MNDIELKFYFDVSSATLECYAKKYDFNLKITYSNVKIDSNYPSDLHVYLTDFLEEFEKSLNKQIEIFYSVR